MEEFTLNTDTGQTEEIPTSENNRRRDVEGVIESRVNQLYSDRLIEYITGLRTGDQRLFERLATDQKIIRAKYGLPSIENLPSFRLADYERFLNGLIEKYKVEVRETSDCGAFFEENPDAGGVYFENENKIGVDINRHSGYTYNMSLRMYEHEIVHAIQHRFYPSMPVEIREYEAYLAFMDFSNLRDADSAVNHLLHQGLVESVKFWYEDQKERGNIDGSPKWNNPRYFLEHVDKVDKLEIDKILGASDQG
jgi:hypothetical protein